MARLKPSHAAPEDEHVSVSIQLRQGCLIGQGKTAIRGVSAGGNSALTLSSKPAAYGADQLEARISLEQRYGGVAKIPNPFHWQPLSNERSVRTGRGNRDRTKNSGGTPWASTCESFGDTQRRRGARNSASDR
jgi:hypothetical protein